MEGMNTTLQLNNSGKKKKINVKRGIFLTCLLTLSVSHFLIFWVYMNFETIRLTFFEYNRFNDLTPISLVVKQNGKVLMNVKHKES